MSSSNANNSFDIDEENIQRFKRSLAKQAGPVNYSKMSCLPEKVKDGLAHNILQDAAMSDTPIYRPMLNSQFSYEIDNPHVEMKNSVYSKKMERRGMEEAMTGDDDEK